MYLWVWLVVLIGVLGMIWSLAEWIGSGISDKKSQQKDLCDR
jgi:hypothetical protein